MSDIETDLPFYNTPLLDAHGNISEVWWRFFAILLTRTGGTVGIDPVPEQANLNDVRALLASMVPTLQKSNADSLLALAPEAVPLQKASAIPDDVPTHGVQVDPSLHALVTGTQAGFMSSADKSKLDGISSGAAVSSVGASLPITSTGGGTPTIGINTVTTSTNGAMLATDKVKLDGMTAGAAVASVSGTAPIASTGGNNPTISISAATTSAAGSMSAADKTKLDSIPGSITNFSAYQSTLQAITAATQTKLLFQTKVFDDNTEYATASSQFVPTVSGTYVFNAGVSGSQTAQARRQLNLYVNGVKNTIMQEFNTGIGDCVIAGSSGPVKLTAGDIVNAYYYSSIAENTAIGSNATYFRGWRIK